MSVEFGTPFRSEMHDVGVNPTHIQALNDVPSKIVRVDQDFRFKFKDFKLARALLLELRDGYQIHIPDFQYIQGWDPTRSRRTVFTIVDKVDGVILWDLNQFKPSEVSHARQQFDNLCANLARYYRDKFASGGLFLILYSGNVKLNHSRNDTGLRSRSDLSDLSVKNALLIELAQSVSMIPGVSRAAATIVGGDLMYLFSRLYFRELGGVITSVFYTFAP